MGYRNIEPVLQHFDKLAQECGLFSDTELNNGYGCLSKSKDKSEPGCCFQSDCPLAYDASLEDLRKHDTHLYEEYKADPGDVGLESGTIESEWVMQYREVV